MRELVESGCPGARVVKFGTGSWFLNENPDAGAVLALGQGAFRHNSEWIRIDRPSVKTMMAFAVLCLAALPPRRRAGRGVVFGVHRPVGSMSELIRRRRKVWAIVSDVAKAKPIPVLRIGLIGYGSADTEYRFFPLTDDLDAVYRDLMTFQTDMGGDEWVGAAVKKATIDMKWSADKNALRVIFMVGNETARQGDEELLYTRTVPEAIRRDIVVNAIYCGKPSQEEEMTWREVAKLADGAYTVIDLSGGAVTIATPMDDRLVELNKRLNATYIPYGKHGKEGDANQVQQDANSEANGGSRTWPSAAANPGTATTARGGSRGRGEGKGLQAGGSEGRGPAGGPAQCRSERKARIEKMRVEREAVQKDVVATNKERRRIAAEMKKNLTQDQAFDEAVRRGREQAGRKDSSSKGSSEFGDQMRAARLVEADRPPLTVRGIDRAGMPYDGRRNSLRVNTSHARCAAT